jgi:geranylgeranyl reductase family protein
MKSNDYQVAIIGCGPAGAAASLFLSQSAIPHIILEQGTFPRDKVCGDGCSGKTAFVLKKANPAFLDEIFLDNTRFLPSYGITFAAPNGRAIDIPFYTEKTRMQRPPGFTSKRLELDHFLFQKTKSPWATVIQDSQVSHIEKSEHGYTLTFIKKQGGTPEQLSCSLLIGADGDKGVSRKTLLQDNRTQKTAAVGLRAYYEGVSDLHPENFIELHFLKEILPGYFWIFPLPNGLANVGIGIVSDVVRKKKINLREMMMKAISENPTIRHRFEQARLTDKIQGWGLPMGTDKTSVSGNNFLIAGDAASLIDPFTGEGIGNALFSGMLAAEAAIEAVKEQRFDAAFLKDKYDDVLFRRIGNELKLSYTMQKLVRFPWLFNMVVNKAQKSPALQSTLTAMFADLDIRAQLRKPSFYWKILTNR